MSHPWKKSRDRQFAQARKQRLSGEPIQQKKVRPGLADLSHLGPERFRVGNCRITYEQMDRDHGSGVDLATILDEDDREALYDQVMDAPKTAIPRLRKLVADHPDCAVLYNWFLCALQDEEGHEREIEEGVVEVARRFPEYLFGQFAYLSMLILKRDLPAADAFVAGRGLITDFAPGREEFHITEFTAFCTTMVQYHVASRRREAAESYLKMMRNVAPDSRPVEQAEAILDSYRLMEIVERAKSGLMDRFFGKSRSKRKTPKPTSSAPSPTHPSATLFD